MGRPRTQLHELLVATTELPSSRIYFQPPANVQMQYPCVVYQRSRANTEFADDNPYHKTKRYQLIIIDRDPDSEIPDRVSDLPMCLFDRFYTANNLNHDVYNIYF